MAPPPRDATDAVLYASADGVATITLNRPDRLNAMGQGPGGMHRALLDAVRRADEDDGVRAVIVTGAGRAFSSGGDLASDAAPRRGSSTAADHYRFRTEGDATNEGLRQSRKPTIGAINGVCYGAALMMAVHLDLLVAAESARFGLIETRFGSIGVEVLAYLVGPQWAKFMALSGELISARKAREIGLVLEVVPDAELMARVGDLARRVAAIPPEAAMLNRRLVNGALEGMGWAHQKELGRALNAVTDAVDETATALDGRRFWDILRDEGWSEFKAARDAPFSEPWLHED